jgi:hypothetical protein
VVSEKKNTENAVRFNGKSKAAEFFESTAPVLLDAHLELNDVGFLP